MRATTWANDPVNSPNHYTRSHPGMECIELTADTTFCLGNAIKYLWRYHSKGRPVEDLEKPDGTYAASSTTAKRSHGRNARPASSPGYAAKPKPTASNTNTAYGETSHSETPTPPSPTSTSS